MRHSLFLFVSVWVLAWAPSADAQKGSAQQQQPHYETAHLSAGFTPDPWTRNLQAGGPNPASTLSQGCTGNVSSRPDFALNYSAGSLPLYIHVTSSTDTTLVVQDPSGRFYCNDDTNGLNPMVWSSSPQSGYYRIWVGVLGSTTLASAQLHITELDPSGVQASGGGSSAPNWTAMPTYTTVNLNAGFSPDPWRYSIQAGGSTAVNSGLGAGCTGYIHAAAPDVDLNYQAGSLSLYFHATSSADTTIVVRDPHGNWHCNDDAIGLNPMVMLSSPPSGNYNIWIGVLNSTQTTPAEVFITEINPR